MEEDGSKSAEHVDAEAAAPQASAAPAGDTQPAAAPKPKPQARFGELDGLRGLAALGVVYFHYFGAFPDMFEGDEWIAPGSHLGFYGVHLFFAISGFVILMTVQRTKSPMDFLLARAGRLYPTYWVAVVLTACVLATGIFEGTEVSSERPLSLLGFFANLTMVQRFANIPDLDGAYWTLAFELAFYFWAFLLLVSKQVERVERYAAGYLICRVVLVLAEDQLHLGRRLSTLLMTEWGHLFVIGMLFYRMRTEGRSAARHVMIAFALASHALHAELESVAAIALVVSIFYALEFGQLAWLAARPLVWLGTLSYSLYVSHEVLGWALMRTLRGLGVPFLPTLAIATAAALGLAWLLNRLVEVPSMNWVKARMRARTQRAQALAAQSSRGTQ